MKYLNNIKWNDLPNALGLKLKIAVVPLTKELATELLEGNTDNNRSKRQARVKQYADDMENQDWCFTGQPIIVSESDKLLDGQHRLQARLDSDAENDPTVLIVRGLPKNIFPYIDNGSPRTSGDALVISNRDVKNPSAIAAVCSLILQETANFTSNRGASPAESIALLSKHTTLQESVTWITGDKQARALLTTSIGGYIHWRTHQIDAEKADEFCEKLTRGHELDKDDVILLLRNRLQCEKDNKKTTFRKKDKLALIIKAWNTFQADKKLKFLRWSEGGKEEFPMWSDIE